MSKEASSEKRTSPATLLIASASSLVAAIVVSHIWGRGTVVGAAVTPVIVMLVSEALHRPARAIQTVRVGRGGSFDPVAEGRRGLREGDLAAARPSPAAISQRRVHRVAPVRRPRRRALLAVATGLVAFAIAAFALTSSELVLGHSAVASSTERTTLFGGSSGGRHAKQKTAAPEKQSSDKGSKATTQPKQTTSESKTPPDATSTTPAPTTTTPAPQQQPQQQQAAPQQQSAPQATTPPADGASTPPPPAAPAR